MSSPKYRNEIPTHAKRDHILVFSKRFDFEIGNSKSRAKAVEAGKDYGIEHLATMQQQKGAAPLSKQEKLTGKFDAPPTEAGPKSLKREKTQSENPYDLVISSEQGRPIHTPQQRNMRDRRLEILEGLRAKKEQALIESKARADFENREDVKRMRSHASATLDGLKRDPKATPQALREAEHLYQLSLSTMEPDDYWRTLHSSLPPEHAPVAVEQDLASRMAAGEVEKSRPRNLYGDV